MYIHPLTNEMFLNDFDIVIGKKYKYGKKIVEVLDKVPNNKDTSIIFIQIKDSLNKITLVLSSFFKNYKK